MAAKTIRSNIALLIELVYMFAKGERTEEPTDNLIMLILFLVY